MRSGREEAGVDDGSEMIFGVLERMMNCAVTTQKNVLFTSGVSSRRFKSARGTRRTNGASSIRAGVSFIANITVCNISGASVGR